MALQLHAKWFQHDSDAYLWAEKLILGVYSFPLDWQLAIELTPKRLRLDDDSELERLPPYNISLSIDPRPLVLNGRPRPRLRTLSASSRFGDAPLPTEAPAQEQIDREPCLLFDCIYGGATEQFPSLLPAEILLRLPHAGADEKVVVDIVVRAGEGSASRELPIGQRIEFLSRRVPLARKLEEFLRWQSGLVYGPPQSYFHRFEQAYTCDASLWGVPERRSGLLRATATGATGPCMTCSAFTNMFLAYWCNYHELYDPCDPSVTTEACAAAHSRFLVKTTPRCKLQHEASGDESTKCQASRGQKWHWQAFYEYLQTDAQEGDIYLCGTGGHAFLVMRFGTTFTARRKYIFGPNDPDAESPCPPGIYQIHASGPGPEQILWASHFVKDKSFGTLKALVERWSSDEALHESGKTRKQTAATLRSQIERVESEGLAGIKVFNATALTLMNCQIRPPRIGEDGSLIHDYGRDYTDMEFCRVADRLYTPAGKKHAFDAWKLRSGILDSDTGWLKTSAVPRDRPVMRYHDCRPLRPMPNPADTESTTNVAAIVDRQTPDNDG